jgi:maltose 6'-phosphate phosphatase
MNIKTFSLTLLVLVFTECSKDSVSDHKPIIDISHAVDGLKVTLTGSVTDTGGDIAGLTIDWGDNNSTKLYGGIFSNLEQIHTYQEPANYDIKVSAADNRGDTTALSVPLTLDFKETSLAGIKGSMFKTSSNEFLTLTINLHTYQEAQQSEKFNLITDLIGKMTVDFIAFQECAQNKSSVISNGIIRVDNMALIISNRLKEKYSADYNFVWSWSHYGWSVWEEGVAVMSKHPLIDSDSRYVSSSSSINNIASRKVIYGLYQTPVGRINIYSAHTHWRTTVTDEEQNNQIKNIKLMVVEKEASIPDSISFVCGDFNGNPTSDYPWSEGYNTMMYNNEYKDTFLEAYPDANSKPAQSIYFTIGGGTPGRIDYIFMKKNSQLNVVDSQIIFKDDVVGKVSDLLNLSLTTNLL